MQVSKVADVEVKEIQSTSSLPPVDANANANASACALLAVRASPHCNIETNKPADLPDTKQKAERGRSRARARGKANARSEKKSPDPLRQFLLGED